eukprot:CAMPEP_0118673190 /NCGR_PEP_ID=MMETSP0800-20121206/183_1 /TAXON_ID=210618 ORGANISM="Striatella unipunctata, Strain CCMP2910" /NCGR_SAMPLE_ID=MMETSP0800 /ASSEMBLY_ACC=CAM_ASM_000638 /LENGTH=382 /DNA_ID=CAMNT_0006568223 /DNA_START=161 /DNA_END=1306 /DNA_ORIENTATION=-
MLYVEQPAGVGFSYSNEVADYTTGDKQAAVDNFVLVQKFFEKFPERKSNPFYIASESYGGHYMPHLALEIMHRNSAKAINFKGFLVGNPYVDPFTNDMTQFELYYSHGLLPKPLFDQWKTKCTDRNTYKSKSCRQYEGILYRVFGDGINPYAVDYPVCTSSHKHMRQSPTLTTKKTLSPLERHLSSSQGMRLLQKIVSTSVATDAEPMENEPPPFSPPEDVYRPCAETFFTIYLNRPDVRNALHVELPPDEKWDICAQQLDYSEDDIGASQMNHYMEIIKILQTNPQYNDFKILVFSGDDDSICSTAGTQAWIYDLGVEYTRLWKPWRVDGQTAGFLTEFVLGTTTNAKFHFATVHGAGHEVPAYRPKEALYMFKAFFSGHW